MSAQTTRRGGRTTALASALRVALTGALVLAAMPAIAAAQTPPSGSAAAWYDATPLLASMRQAERAGAAQAAGVARAEDLPLYDLTIDLDLGAGAVAVREEIWFTNREAAPLAEVVLRIFANTAHPSAAQPAPRATRRGQGAPAAAPPQRAPVRFDGGRCLDGGACSVTSPDPGVIVVRPATPLAPGARLRIAVDLGATLERIDSARTNLMAQGLEGMTSMQSGESAGDYGLVAIGDGIASLANFYAVLARRESGRWVRSDDSALGDLGTDDLAHFRAHVRVGSGVRVVSTGVTLPATRRTATPASTPAARAASSPARTEIVAAYVRDFALLASRDFQIATRDVGGVTVRSWFRPSERAAGEHVLDVAASALGIFTQRFGAYPYTELDVVEAAIIGGAGGIEFAGLVTIASMFYKAPSAGASVMDAMTARMREFVTAHEVAHQFWHGLVGSDSRAHPFVDEGLAQWSAMLYLQDRYGQERATRDGDMQVRMNYQMMRMQNVADAPVDRPVRDFASPLAYAGLVYGKGPYVYEALRQQVGDATFFATLQEYVRTYRFRTAPQRGFIDLLARGAHTASVRAIARRWLDERHGDADLGRGDMRALAGSMLGLDASALPAELGGLMNALGGGAGGGSAGGGGGLDLFGGGAGGAGSNTPNSGGDATGGVGMQGVEELIRMLQGAGQ